MPERTGDIEATWATVHVGEELPGAVYDLTEESLIEWRNRTIPGIGEWLVLPDGRRAAPVSIISADYAKVMYQKFSALGLAHARSRLEPVKLLIPPLRVAVAGKIVDKYIRRGREYFDVEVTIRDDTGDLLVRNLNSYWMNASVRHESDTP